MAIRSLASTGLALFAGSMLAQPPPIVARFDVASVRAANGGKGGVRGGPGSSDPGRIAYSSITLKDLLSRAYGIEGFRVSGPGWISVSRYEIAATLPSNTSQEVFKLMLQTLLVARFGLKAHRETKELPVYSLVLRKDGAKFKQTDPTAPHPGGLPVPGGGSLVTEDDGHTMHFYAVSMASLISLLSNWADRPVQDKTGLTGRYDFQLKRPALGSPSTQPVEGDSRPSIPSALEELGLRLESTKGPVEIFVVDHVERPAAN